MTPPKPANDESPPLWPGLSSRAEYWIWQVISWTVLLGGGAFALAVLDLHHWIAVGITVGIGFVVTLVAGLWGAFIGGRS